MLKIRFKDKRKIAVFAHDAGAAELISSYLKSKKIPNIKFCLKGPAIKIFEKKFKKIQNSKMPQVFKDTELIITGTSWDSHHDLKAIYLANKLSINSATFIDHYTNYKQRFIKNNKLILPKLIYVTDKYSYQKFKENFKNFKNICLIKNTYFEELKTYFKSTVSKKKKKKNLDILYLTEPISQMAQKLHSNKNYYGFDEYQALLFFLKKMNKIKKIRITIKLHPSEKKSKYNWINLYSNTKFKFSQNKDIIKEILNNDIIVSCGSIALKIAEIFKKKIICSSPKNSNYFQLPIKNIRFLENVKKF